MRSTLSDWEVELARWLKPFLDRLGHKARRRMFPLYVAGLIGPGDRKSVQPMAERLAAGNYNQLHHFIAAGVWHAAPLETELLIQADKLVGEHRLSGERKYFLANLPNATDLRTLAATIKARWICEQAHQQMKEELGLDHFEGRSWQGLHRHALMTMLAFAFLQHRRLKTARRGKKNQWTATSTKFAGRPSRHRRAHRSTAAEAMPALSKMDMQKFAARINLPK